jgi:hypothetical protein
VTGRLLEGHPGTLEPNPDLGDLLNALVDLRRWPILLVLRLLPRAEPQKSISQDALVSAITMSWQCKVKEQIKQIE